MANHPPSAGVTGCSGPITIIAGQNSGMSYGGILIFTPGVASGAFGTLWEEYRYGSSRLEVRYDEMILEGDVKEAALAIAKEVFDSRDRALSTTKNYTLKINHSDNHYYLEYVGNNDKPDFFDELNYQFERICKIKAFV